jgi:hypothetical protein
MGTPNKIDKRGLEIACTGQGFLIVGVNLAT